MDETGRYVCRKWKDRERPGGLLGWACCVVACNKGEASDFASLRKGNNADVREHSEMSKGYNRRLDDLSVSEAVQCSTVYYSTAHSTYHGRAQDDAAHTYHGEAQHSTA